MVRLFLFLTLTSLSSFALQPLKTNKIKNYVKAGAKNESACFINFRTQNFHCMRGTGVLIAPRYVLTCAHVVPGAKAGAVIVPSGRVTFETNLEHRSNHFDGYRIERVIISPLYKRVDGIGDLALLRLDRSVQGIKTAPFIHSQEFIALKKLAAAPLSKGQLTACGYGMNTVGKRSVKLGGEYHAVDINDNGMFVKFAKSGKIPSLMMPGDSGGPIYFKGRLLGLTQGIMFPIAVSALVEKRQYHKLIDHASCGIATPVVHLRTGKLRPDLIDMMKTLGLKEKEIKKIGKKK